MFPLIALALLGIAALSYGSKKIETIKVNPGDVFRITVHVLGAQDHAQIEAMYRVGMAQVGQIGTLIWDGDDMIIQVQYLVPSEIKLGTTRAGTTSITVLKAELMGRGQAPVTFKPPGGVTAATVGAVTRRALRSGDPADLMGAAAVAEKAGARKLSRALLRSSLRSGNSGYKVRA
jgi:hypothetical protein